MDIGMFQNHIKAIPCDFKFLDSEPLHTEKIFDKIDILKYDLTTTIPLYGSFECEERDDDFVQDKLS